MSDKEFLAMADQVIAHVRTICQTVLDIVDLHGEPWAIKFLMENSDPKYHWTPDILRRMLRAANGADDIEIITIAASLYLRSEKDDDGEGWKRPDKPC